MVPQSKRGFAAMAPQKQQEIARRGGQIAHKKGTAHEFTPEEARIAGQRGGKAVSSNRQYMAEIGQKGGRSAGRNSAKLRKTWEGEGAKSPDNRGTREVNQTASHRATDLIRADHREVERLFKQYEVEEQQSQKESLVRRLCWELDAHAQSEEEIFYSAFQHAQQEGNEQLVTEALEEHRTIKNLIGHLQEMSINGGPRDSTMQQLKECVTHHVEEEEKHMLPQAETLLSEQLESLGARMQQRKRQLLEGASEPASAEVSERRPPQSE